LRISHAPCARIAYPKLITMGAGASSKGYSGKEAVVGDVKECPCEWMDMTQVQGYVGEKFNFEMAKRFGAAMNADEKVHKIKVMIETCLIKVASDDDGMLDQPKNPKKQTCVVQIYIDSHKFGGTDKSCNGHRYDTIPFVNGMINAGLACYPVHYVHSQHDTFFKVMENMDAILVRCNPGQIKADGGDQGKFDDAMRALQKKGIPVWPSPDVMEFMGAKDALTKIRNLQIGMPDTGTYFTEDEFIAGISHLAMQGTPIETTQILQLLRDSRRALQVLHGALYPELRGSRLGPGDTGG